VTGFQKLNIEGISLMKYFKLFPSPISKILVRDKTNNRIRTNVEMPSAVWTIQYGVLHTSESEYVWRNTAFFYSLRRFINYISCSSNRIAKTTKNIWHFRGNKICINAPLCRVLSCWSAIIIREPLNGLSWNFVLGNFNKSIRKKTPWF
jgi:hypothetical protein